MDGLGVNNNYILYFIMKPKPTMMIHDCKSMNNRYVLKLIHGFHFQSTRSNYQQINIT